MKRHKCTGGTQRRSEAARPGDSDTESMSPVIPSSPEGPEAGRDGGLGAKANEAGEREEQWEEADCKRWGCCPQVKDRLVPHRWGFHPRDGRCDGLNVRDPSPQVYMLNPNLQR